MRVLVLDAATTQALTTVRALGSRGIEVDAADSVRWAKTFFSRFCANKLTYPPPETGVDAFLKALQDLLRARHYDLLLPMSDRTMLPVSRWRQELQPFLAALPLPPHDAVETALDKEKTLHVAQQLGVPTPLSQRPDNPAQLHDLASAGAFPLVVKPRASYRLEGDRIVAGGRPQYVFHQEKFQATYQAVHERSPWPLIQEFVPGVGFGVFALMHHGKLRVLFGHQRLRDVFPTGSGSSYRVSVPVEPRLRDYTVRLLQALNWHGVAMVEFKQDIRDNMPKLMEINGRFWGSLPLAVAAGVDFPYLLCRMALEGDIEELLTYRLGVKCRWLVGDLVHLGQVLKGPPRGWPGPFPQRTRTVLDLLHLFGDNLYYDDFQFRDVKPFGAEVLDYVCRRLPKLWGKRHA